MLTCVSIIALTTLRLPLNNYVLNIEIIKAASHN